MTTLHARTFADWQTHLGDIPAGRILAHPEPGTATETDLLDCLESHDKRLVELIDGTLVEKPMGQKESRITSRLLFLLEAYFDATDFGWFSGPDGASRMIDGNLRMPDISVFPWEMFPDGEMDDEKIASVCPWLGIEVLSESNTPGEMAKKLSEYFASGMREAWLVDPETKTVKVYTSVKRANTLAVADTLSGGNILPGFACELAKLFAIGERRRRKA
jgi:Uma2 family endonuclease